MSLEVQTIKMSGKASLNLSLEIDRRSILEVLENEGFVIIQGATDINSSERAKFNKYITAILQSARDGNFEPSRPRHWPYPSLINAPILRAPNWKELSKDKELLAITCYHLGGAESVKWHWEFDRGLSGPESDSTHTVEAHGRDMYVSINNHPWIGISETAINFYRIICNGWLAQRFPKPEEEMDMIMIQYRWTGFNWD